MIMEDGRKILGPILGRIDSHHFLVSASMGAEDFPKKMLLAAFS